MSQASRIIIDGQPQEFQPGDSLLMAALRADLHPTGGGCLCHAGDCAHCLLSVDGVAYVRACQTLARPGMVVERHHLKGYPPLDFEAGETAQVVSRKLHCDTLVIGMGLSGQEAAKEAMAAAKQVICLDAQAEQEVIGIYTGPLVVARTPEAMLEIYPKEIVIATGAAEIQPVAEGSHLAGLLTARACTLLHRAGLSLGRVVAIGEAPEGLEVEQLAGELLRFEGEDKVTAVIMKDAQGQEQRYPCDTVSLALGLQPRDGLVRMAEGLDGVRAVGDCARSFALPPCPKAGIVCTCSGVSVADLDFSWEQGFREMELLKRATLAGTGTCQGSACLPHLRSFLLERGGTLQAAFTARPLSRQVSMAEMAAGAHLQPNARTALDAEHRKLGAYMQRMGGWWRPWHYGNTLAEYWAVREAVSLGDVSTLGKMVVSGPDVLEFLERLYPTKVSTIKTGRSRYVLLLDERGYVVEDGLIAKDSDSRYSLTFTSGGSSFAEAWLRDWAESWKLDVRIMNQTQSLGAINVTGPLAKKLLERAGLANPPDYLHHQVSELAGIRCKIFRLSFTGELSFELHHPAEDSVKLWRSLLALGQDLGIRPHGLEALLRLRLEKGHIIVGQDTDFDSSPRRINHEWAINLNKDSFVGKYALERTNKIPLDKQLVGFTMDCSTAPHEGTSLWLGERYVGYLTSSSYSAVLGKVVMLGWLDVVDGELPKEILINGQLAQRASLPFYDPEAHRARA